MEARENKLQALVICDRFSPRFNPVSLEKPEILYPVANIPILEYVLEFLFSTEASEIFVASCNHAQQVEDYIKSSPWAKKKATIRVLKYRLSSLGAVMRKVHEEGHINSDFILINGPVVTNLRFDAVVAAHRARKDKNAVATMIFKQANPTHPARKRCDTPVVGIDAATQRLVSYESPISKLSEVSIDAELLHRGMQLQLRADLAPTDIFLCSSDVPNLFMANFDWSTATKFVVEILSSILGHTIYTHVLTREYALPVTSWHRYDVVSRDVINRWSYPLVPEALCAYCRYHRKSIYRWEDVECHRSVTIGCNTVLGNGAKVGENTTLRNSVIGRNCRIGKNCYIENAYLWDGVRIADGTRMTHALVTSKCAVGTHCTVPPGCILAPETSVPADTALSERARYCTQDLADRGRESAQGGDEGEEEDEDDDEDAFSMPLPSPSLSSKRADDDEGDAEASDEEWGAGMRIRALPVRTFCRSSGPLEVEEEEEEEEIEADYVRWVFDEGEACVALAPPPEEDAGEEEEEEEGEAGETDSTETFMNEVGRTFIRGINEGCSRRDVETEINGLRFGFDQQANLCGIAMARAVLLDALRPGALTAPAPAAQGTAVPADFIEILKERVGHEDWNRLLQNYIGDEDGQLECIYNGLARTVEKEAPELTQHFQNILDAFYDKDIISEDAILKWAEEMREDDDGDSGLLMHCREFVEWLQNADDEEEEEDSDEDSDEDE